MSYFNQVQINSYGQYTNLLDDPYMKFRLKTNQLIETDNVLFHIEHIEM